MKLPLHILTLLLSLTASCSGEVRLSTIAGKVAEKGIDNSGIELYQGSCFLHGLAEYSLAAGDRKLEKQLTDVLDKFQNGELRGKGSLISYSIGGSASALMALNGRDYYSGKVKEVADSMFRTQPRNCEGVMVPPWRSASIRPDGMFVDLIFAITPYLLYSGLLDGNTEWIDYSAWIALKTFEVLRDNENGLIHQARGVLRLGEGEISQDNWSRGNGWGSVALAALMKDLPAENRYYNDVRALCADYYSAVLRFQDEDGLWHQEMSRPDSWQEVSGSALLLYGIGTCIQTGILPETCRDFFIKGLQGLLAYVDADGNIASVCGGCLAPGNSSKDTYASQASFWNEKHSFGPVLLALSAARRLGIRSVQADLGSKTADRRPACVVRHVEARKDDIAWENDWTAYRIYSLKSPVNKIGSGIDYWAKTVDYPILDKWYAANSAGGSYHDNQGEGCDFYVVGKNRGLGGNGVWKDGILCSAMPYQDWKINEESPERISFTVSYPPYAAGVDTIRQASTVSCILGSPFTCIETTVTSDSGDDVTVAAGLTTFGDAKVFSEADGRLWLHEMTEGVDLHSVLIADPSRMARREEFGADRLLLMDVHSGETVRYYISANSNLSSRMSEWNNIIKESTWDKIEKQYGND
jgi:rhamnogalacturonyl hydrolase YesR